MYIYNTMINILVLYSINQLYVCFMLCCTIWPGPAQRPSRVRSAARRRRAAPYDYYH